MVKDLIPRAKRKISTFLREDKGSISKQSMLTIGAVISTIAASSLLSLKDVKGSSITLTTTGSGAEKTVTASHSHHASHTSY